MAKYLDYEGLKTYDQKAYQRMIDIIGTGYAISDNKVNVKDYIDSRIFVGSAADVELALSQKKIDEKTFTMIVDENASEVTSIPDSEIRDLFA